LDIQLSTEVPVTLSHDSSLLLDVVEGQFDEVGFSEEVEAALLSAIQLPEGSKPQKTCIAADRQANGGLADAAASVEPFFSEHGVRSGPYEYQGHNFCSSYEAACAFMLQRYIPGFVLVEGATYQVPVARSRRGDIQCIDFLVRGNIFVEYHALLFGQSDGKTGDFTNDIQQRAYRKILSSSLLNDREKEAFRALAESALRENYRRKRTELLAEHSRFRRSSLVVVTTAAELFELVIAPYGSFAGSQEAFEEQFEALRAKVLESNYEIIQKQIASKAKRKSRVGRERGYAVRPRR
jgi:hypothetical protein